MGIIVSKFGGSSVADAACFRRVRDLIGRTPKPSYIVLSAPGKSAEFREKVTDLLLRAHALCASGAEKNPALDEVRRRFLQLHRALHLSLDANSLLASLERDAAHSADAAASRGEFLCARWFADYAHLPFEDAADLIFFDARGALMREKTFHAIRQMSRRHPRAVIPGFYGSAPDGEIKTFSRGGSDITGALIAAALGASLYENWTDTDGLMSADPAVCPDALPCAAIGYRQMQRLSLAGAAILHPSCLEPVLDAQIPTVLKNTFRPDARGTCIRSGIDAPVRCICARKDRFAAEVSSPNEKTKSLGTMSDAEVFQSSSGAFYRALPAPLGRSPAVSIVSAFGLPPEKWPSVEEAVHPIAMRTDGDCLQLMVPVSAEAQAVRTLHALLIQKNGKPQLPVFDS